FGRIESTRGPPVNASVANARPEYTGRVTCSSPLLASIAVTSAASGTSSFAGTRGARSRPCALAANTIAYVSPSACAATVAAATSGEYCASASFSTTSTLSAPQRPSSPAPPATPGGPSSTACTSAPTASAIVRAAPTTSFDTL